VLNAAESVPVSSLVGEQVAWQILQLREGERGPVEVTCWSRRVWTIGADGEVREEWLLVHRQSNGAEHYSLSNGSADTPLATMMGWRGQRYFVERTFQDEKSELGWDELVAQKYRAWMHHAALTALALYFVMSVRRRWAREHPRAGGLKEEFGIPKLPALSVANMKVLLVAVMQLPQFTLREALRVVIDHLENRARSTRSRYRSHQQKRQPCGGSPSPDARKTKTCMNTE
jgi:hypothetical protein